MINSPWVWAPKKRKENNLHRSDLSTISSSFRSPSWSTTSLTTFSCLENRFMTPWSSLLALSSYIQESGPRKWKLDSTKITQKRVNWILKMVLIAPSTLSWWMGRPRWWSPRGPPRQGPPMQWLGHVGLLHVQICTCVNHLPWASIDNDTRTRMAEIQTQVPGTHLGLSGVGARDTYLWVQTCFVLAKQLIHFKPSLLVDLSDN